jgi:hypothetical protein
MSVMQAEVAALRCDSVRTVYAEEGQRVIRNRGEEEQPTQLYTIQTILYHMK